MQLCYANMPEWIEVLRGLETLEDPRNIVLDRNPDFPHVFDVAFARLLCPVVFGLL